MWDRYDIVEPSESKSPFRFAACFDIPADRTLPTIAMEHYFDGQRDTIDIVLGFNNSRWREQVTSSLRSAMYNVFEDEEGQTLLTRIFLETTEAEEIESVFQIISEIYPSPFNFQPFIDAYQDILQMIDANKEAREQAALEKEQQEFEHNSGFFSRTDARQWRAKKMGRDAEAKANERAVVAETHYRKMGL